MRNFLKSFIRFYRLFFSAWMGGQCRFEPTCSQYALDALDVLPVSQAITKITKRLLCCHPFHAGGFDPVLDSTFVSMSSKEIS